MDVRVYVASAAAVVVVPIIIVIPVWLFWLVVRPPVLSASRAKFLFWVEFSQLLVTCQATSCVVWLTLYIFFCLCSASAFSSIEKRHCAYISVYYPSNRFFWDFENQAVNERCGWFELDSAVKVLAKNTKLSKSILCFIWMNSSNFIWILTYAWIIYNHPRNYNEFFYLIKSFEIYLWIWRRKKETKN